MNSRPCPLEASFSTRQGAGRGPKERFDSVRLRRSRHDLFVEMIGPLAAAQLAHSRARLLKRRTRPPIGRGFRVHLGIVNRTTRISVEGEEELFAKCSHNCVRCTRRDQPGIRPAVRENDDILRRFLEMPPSRAFVDIRTRSVLPATSKWKRGRVRPN